MSDFKVGDTMGRELERLRKQKDEAICQVEQQLERRKQVTEHLTQVRDEYDRVVEMSGQAGYVLDKIDRDFKEKTKLSGGDIVLLFLCTALQCARQYLLSGNAFRLTAVQGDTLMENTVGKAAGIIKPEWSDVLLQSVPYDAIIAIQEINKGYPRQKTNQHSRMDGSARKPEQYHAGAGVII